MFKVDAVILWVDGADPDWQAKKHKYVPNKGKEDAFRYRNYDTLKYLLRSIDQNMHWLNKVYLVTDDQLPKYVTDLGSTNKLQVVDHKDFIPNEYLPTFNSNVIELNLHRIKGLSDHFILFNDDMLINSPTEVTDFYTESGIPKDQFVLSVSDSSVAFSHIILNNMLEINQRFSKREVIKANKGKILKLAYGKYLMRTVLAYPWHGLTGFYNPHNCIAYTKNEYKRAWDYYGEGFDRTCYHRVRTNSDLSNWLIRYTRLCESDFVPKRFDSVYYTLNDLSKIKRELDAHKYKQVCLNDAEDIKDFDLKAHKLDAMLERHYPNESIFEK